jgi:hypothetical protein
VRVGSGRALQAGKAVAGRWDVGRRPAGLGRARPRGPAQGADGRRVVRAGERPHAAPCVGDLEAHGRGGPAGGGADGDGVRERPIVHGGGRRPVPAQTEAWPTTIAPSPAPVSPSALRGRSRGNGPAAGTRKIGHFPVFSIRHRRGGRPAPVGRGSDRHGGCGRSPTPPRPGRPLVRLRPHGDRGRRSPSSPPPGRMRDSPRALPAAPPRPS